MFITCAATATGAALTTCLTNTIQTFGRKAFRRPLTAAEVTSFLRFKNLTPAGTTNEVAESVLYAILASPSFIPLPELADDRGGHGPQADQLRGGDAALVPALELGSGRHAEHRG